MRMTPDDIVRLIGGLRTDREYHYINEANAGRIQIVEAQRPQGPIVIKRYNPDKGQLAQSAESKTISTAMLRRVANAVRPGVPLNIDRVLGASYNTRSVLEALLAHTPPFYVCRPGRIELLENSQKIEPGHKHIMWKPDEPHAAGTIATIETELVISEVPSTEVVYEALIVPDPVGEESNLDPELRRRHAQIQVALVHIAEALGMKSFVARNDQAIVYKGARLGEHAAVISDLGTVPVLSAIPRAVSAGSLIDCIWFRNGRHMPAVIEVEHTTGVTSGLTRMQRFAQVGPSLQTRYLIAAPDEDRDRVARECARDQFRDIRPGYLPYSSVEELLGIVQRRKMKGVTDEFIEGFIERAA